MEMFNLPRSELMKSKDPYFLNPANARGQTRQPDVKFIKYDEDVKKWTAPFFMAAINTRVVRRSNALAGNSYGPNFSYSEVMSCSSIFHAFIVWFMSMLFLILLAIPVIRSLMCRVLPKPGEGPSEKDRKEGFFKVTFIGETQPENETEKPVKVTGQVNGYADPGYAETAKMISEAAICLASLPPGVKGGVITPAESMGMALVERLRNAGMTFEIKP